MNREKKAKSSLDIAMKTYVCISSLESVLNAVQASSSFYPPGLN